MNKKYLLAIPIIAVFFFALGITVTHNYYVSTMLNAGLNFGLNTPRDEYGNLLSEVAGVHIDAWVTRANGEVEYLGHHAGTMTQLGYNQTKGQLFDENWVSTANVTKYGSLSTTDISGYTALQKYQLTQVPSELAANGLARAEMTFTRGSSAKTCTFAWTWTAATAPTSNVQTFGMNYLSSGNLNLMWVDSFTATTLQIGDTITITATITQS